MRLLLQYVTTYFNNYYLFIVLHGIYLFGVNHCSGRMEVPMHTKTGSLGHQLYLL